MISCLTTGRLSGVDIFALDLTRELLRRGFRARIALSEHDEQVADPLRLPDDVPVDRLPIRHLDNGWRRRRVMTEYLMRQAPCIYLPNYDYRHSSVVAHLPNSVVVVGMVHSDDPMHYDHARRLAKYWNATVAVSQAIVERTSEWVPQVKGKIRHIPYGVRVPAVLPAREVTSASAPLRVLYTGRLEQPQKRVLDLPAILDRLSEQGVSLELTVIGGGEARAQLIERSRQHLDSGRMRLVDTLPHDQLLDAYRRADVFLLTSAFEGLPVSLLEAMAAGCVPVVSDIRSGVPELIEEGQSGFRVPIGDVSQFAERLALLAEDRGRLGAMSATAFRAVSRPEYTLEGMMDSFCWLFGELHEQVQSGQYLRPRPWPAEMLTRRVWTATSRRVRRRWHRLLGHPVPGEM